MRFNSPRQFCISLWKVAGALQSLKAMRSHSKNPKLPTVKVVYCFDAFSIFICQNPNLRSRLEKNVQHLPNSPMPPVFWAEGGSPFFMHAFKWQKSMQNCRPPSFFLTNTTALHHTLWLGQIAPDSNISQRWFWTSSTKGGGIHLNCSSKGVSSITFIVYLVEWVQSNSVGSNKNTSWYLAKNWQAASTISEGKESNPLKSNSSNSFPCHCLIVNFGAQGSWGSFPLPVTGLSLVTQAVGSREPS